MTDHSQTAGAATATPDSAAGQDRIYAEVKPEAVVYDITHPHDAPVSAPQFVMHEKRKAGDYTPLDLLNEYVATPHGWTQEKDGRYRAVIWLEKDEEKIANHAKNQETVHERGIAPSALGERDIYTQTGLATLHRAENQLASITAPLGSKAGIRSLPYEVIPATDVAGMRVTYITVKPEDIDLVHAAKNHGWTDEELLKNKPNFRTRDQLIEDAGAQALATRWSIEALIEQHEDEIKKNYAAVLKEREQSGKVLVLNEAALFGDNPIPEYLVKPSHDVGSMTSDASREEMLRSDSVLDKLASGATRLEHFRVNVDGQNYLIIPADNNTQQAADWSAQGAQGLYSAKGGRQPVNSYKSFNPLAALKEQLAAKMDVSSEADLNTMLHKAQAQMTDDAFFTKAAESWLDHVRSVASTAGAMDKKLAPEAVASSRAAGIHSYLAGLRTELASHVPLAALADGLDEQQIAALSLRHEQRQSRVDATGSRGERSHIAQLLANNVVESGPLSR